MTQYHGTSFTHSFIQGKTLWVYRYVPWFPCNSRTLRKNQFHQTQWVKLQYDQRGEGSVVRVKMCWYLTSCKREFSSNFEPSNFLGYRVLIGKRTGRLVFLLVALLCSQVHCYRPKWFCQGNHTAHKCLTDSFTGSIISFSFRSAQMRPIILHVGPHVTWLTACESKLSEFWH